MEEELQQKVKDLVVERPLPLNSQEPIQSLHENFKTEKEIRTKKLSISHFQ